MNTCKKLADKKKSRCRNPTNAKKVHAKQPADAKKISDAILNFLFQWIA